jgi:hypothetical protein
MKKVEKYLKSSGRLALYVVISAIFVYNAIDPKDNDTRILSIMFLPLCYLGLKDCIERRKNELRINEES